MNEKAFTHSFELFGNYYIYDVNKNKMLKTSKDTYAAISKTHSDRAHNTATDVTVAEERLLKLMEDGYFDNNNIKEIIHPADSYIEYFFNNKVRLITLQITQECNLRCSYCVYSGGYENRRHSLRKMEIETAKKGVDFLIKHSKDSEIISVGFYGGEPLLEFELIKQIVEYAEKKALGRKLDFTITTNGTLITEEIISYFCRHNFSLLVSLDGPKEIHDKNRHFASDGRGTFDTIMENMSMIKSKFPDYTKRISISLVLDPSNEFKCTNDFFNCDATNTISFNSLTTNFITDKYKKNNNSSHSENFYLQWEYEKFKLFLSLINRLDSSLVSKAIQNSLNDLKFMNKSLKYNSGKLEKVHHGGPCMPGVNRLFMDVDGVLYPCERVSESSDVIKIGHIDSGFDIEKARAILNFGKISEESCKKCWAIRFCTLCVAHADDLSNLSAQKKLSQCKNVKDYTMSKLKDYCALKEVGYDFETDLEVLSCEFSMEEM